MKYFGHSVMTRDDKSIEYLTNKFSGDGYAVWFCILEELGKCQENLYTILMTPKWLKELSASINIKQKKIETILDFMAKRGMINKELFDENIIFSSNFVNNHGDYLFKLYENEENIEKKFFEKIKKDIQFWLEEYGKTNTYEKIIQIHSGLISDSLGYIKRNKKKRKNINILTKEKSDSVKITEPTESQTPEITSPEIVSNLPAPETDESDMVSESVEGEIKQPEKIEEPKAGDPKRTFKLYDIASEEYHIAAKFAKEIKQRDKGADANVQKWANDIFYMSNGRDRSEIEKVLSWALSDSFWSSIIVNPKKLFEHYTTLKQKMGKPNGSIDNAETEQSDYEFFLQRELERDRRNGIGINVGVPV